MKKQQTFGSLKWIIICCGNDMHNVYSSAQIKSNEALGSKCYVFLRRAQIKREHLQISHSDWRGASQKDVHRKNASEGSKYEVMQSTWHILRLEKLTTPCFLRQFPPAAEDVGSIKRAPLHRKIQYEKEWDIGHLEGIVEVLSPSLEAVL